MYFSRTLKPNYHVNHYLRENLENKLNGLTRILGKHGNFNRIEFGNALWISVLRPTIAHCCSTWIPSSQTQRDLLQSLQYRAAKIILRTKMNIPIGALLLELGWEPINDFLDRQRTSYFLRMSGLDNSRLCKIVFDELHGKNLPEWPFFNHMKHLFELIGLDHFITGNFSLSIFNKFFGANVRTRVFEMIRSKPSLQFYSYFNVTHGTQKYLLNLSDFKSSRLKLLARTNCLPINAVLARMHLRPNSVCEACHGIAVEDTDHILFECSAYASIRNELFSKIFLLFEKENISLDFVGLSPFDKKLLLIGDLGYMYTDDVGTAIDNLCKIFLHDVFIRRAHVTETNTF